MKVTQFNAYCPLETGRAAKIGMSIVVGYHRIGLLVHTRSCEH